MHIEKGDENDFYVDFSFDELEEKYDCNLKTIYDVQNFIINNSEEAIKDIVDEIGIKDYAMRVSVFFERDEDGEKIIFQFFDLPEEALAIAEEYHDSGAPFLNTETPVNLTLKFKNINELSKFIKTLSKDFIKYIETEESPNSYAKLYKSNKEFILVLSIDFPIDAANMLEIADLFAFETKFSTKYDILYLSEHGDPIVFQNKGTLSALYEL